MMMFIWLLAIIFAIISVFTSSPAPLIAGLILVGIGAVVENI